MQKCDAPGKCKTRSSKGWKFSSWDFSGFFFNMAMIFMFSISYVSLCMNCSKCSRELYYFKILVNLCIICLQSIIVPCFVALNAQILVKVIARNSEIPVGTNCNRNFCMNHKKLVEITCKWPCMNPQNPCII